MWSWLASFLSGPVVNGLIGAYKAKLDASNKTDALAADLAAKEIAGEVALRQQEASIIRQEQGWWVTALIRPLWTAPFIIYTWKIVVWDIVLKMGSTDPVRGDLATLMMIIAGAYFGGRSIEKAARIFARR